jgi:DNA ligase (NAD+)
VYGILTQASTRWNWTIWEDITHHAKNIINLPHDITSWRMYEAIHLRWEVVMSGSAFERINAENIAIWKTAFANARNAAAWTLRQLNPSLVYSRWLECYVFEVLIWSELLGVETDSEQLERIRAVGIPIHPWLKTDCSIEEVITLCEDSEVQQETQYGDIACDGLVIKIDSLAHRKVLGSTQHHPKRAIAYKYPAQEVTAHLQSIERQVWRTWVITPVAILEPVAVSWVIVQRATLHNLAFIRDRKLISWVDVRIKRSGEVIPYVVGLVDDKTWGICQTLLTCPSCDSVVYVSDDYIRTQCLNTQCPAQQKEKLKHYVSRDAANIDGLWWSTLELLYEKGIISNIDSLYVLNTPEKKQQCLAMIGIWEKKYARICDSIEKTKILPLYTILYGIGISWIWRKLAKTLVQWLEEWKNIYSYKVDIVTVMQEYFVSESLGSLYGIWSELTRSIALRIENNQSIQLLEKLNEYGVLWFWRSWSVIYSNKEQWWFFSGKKVLITGSFSLARRQIIDHVEAQWWMIVSSVSVAVDFLLVWEKPWSKYQKAIDIWIAVLYENEFISSLYDESQENQINKDVSSWENTQQESLFD